MCSSQVQRFRVRVPRIEQHQNSVMLLPQTRVQTNDGIAQFGRGDAVENQHLVRRKIAKRAQGLRHPSRIVLGMMKDAIRDGLL